jgi:hypothetical protein
VALAPPSVDVERVRRGAVRVAVHETRDAGVAECLRDGGSVHVHDLVALRAVGVAAPAPQPR